MSSWSQRARFWSSRSTGSPAGPTRAAKRDAWISISATRPCTSGSSGASPARMRPSRSASSQSCGPHPVVARGRRVALVEHEVDHLEHRREPRGALGAARDLERNARLGQRALGADDALRDGRLRHQKRARDLVGGQAAEQAQRQRDPRLGREHRMARGEHQPQQIVADVVVDRLVDVLQRRFLLGLELAAELFVLALRELAAAQPVDRAVLGGGHQPRARLVRNARLRPLLERGDQRVLRELLGQTDVAHDPGEPGDQLRLLDPPDRVDCAMGIGAGLSAVSASVAIAATDTPSAKRKHEAALATASPVSCPCPGATLPRAPPVRAERHLTKSPSDRRSGAARTRLRPAPPGTASST